MPLELIKELSNFSAIGVVALALMFVWYMAKNRNGKDNQQIYKQVLKSVEQNHLKDIEDKIDKLDTKIESKFTSVWRKLNEHSDFISFMKGKFNNK